MKPPVEIIDRMLSQRCCCVFLFQHWSSTKANCLQLSLRPKPNSWIRSGSNKHLSDNNIDSKHEVTCGTEVCLGRISLWCSWRSGSSYESQSCVSAWSGTRSVAKHQARRSCIWSSSRMLGQARAEPIQGKGGPSLLLFWIDHWISWSKRCRRAQEGSSTKKTVSCPPIARWLEASLHPCHLRAQGSRLALKRVKVLESNSFVDIFLIDWSE